MNCAEANQLDVIEYLHELGYQAEKIGNDDYWYLSPLREEKHASFKVNKKLNVWYDHGLGKGGKLLDFTMQYFHCNVSEALQKISSFHQQKGHQNTVRTQPFQRNKTCLATEGKTTEIAIEILAAKQPVTDLFLCRYLSKRRIAKDISNGYCHEVIYRAK